MKLRLTALSLAFFLILLPAVSQANDTRVYLNVSIGGAIVLGGGFILWRIGYRQRLAEREKIETGKSHARLFDGKVDPPRVPAAAFMDKNTGAIGPIALELPIFRW
jgi:hypothetical protein